MMFDFLIFSLIFLAIFFPVICVAANLLGLWNIDWEKSIDWKSLR